MSQNDFTIDNQTFPATRSDLNSALQALASTSSGGTAPSPPFANQLWYDTSTNILKIYNEAMTAWINLLYVDQSTDLVSYFDNSKVVNSSGTQVGLLGGQASSTWLTGTGTVESFIDPATLKATTQRWSGKAFLGSTDASTSASIRFTAFDAALYDSYEFVVSNLIPTTDAVNLYLRTSTNGGSSYDTGSSDYAYTAVTARPEGVDRVSSSGVGYILLTGQTVGSDTNEDGWSGNVTIHNPELTKRTMISYKGGFTQSDGSLGIIEGTGMRLASADVDAVEFIFSSGTIESGTISMYGLRNS